MTSPRLGVCFPRELPAPLLVEFVEKLDSSGADEVWVIEDCFYTAGISLAATGLAHTERLAIGIGILPAVVRSPAITAMELATLAELAPGRLIAGIGHGVQDWMGQIGLRPDSPVTALTEVITTVRRLLAGEEVTFSGRHLTMENVKLTHPPRQVPPVLAGVRRPKSLAAAGRCADGIVLTVFSGPSAVRQAIGQAAPTGPFQVATYTALSINKDRQAARRDIAPWIVEVVNGGSTPGLLATPFYEELRALVTADGIDGLLRVPDDWWLELGAIGNPDDVVAHVEAQAAAGAHSVSFFPAPFADVAMAQLDQLIADVVFRR